MCCQRSTARPNRHKSIGGEMKRAEAWCVCPLSCQGRLMGTKQHIRRRCRTDQPSGDVKNEKKTLVTRVPEHKGHTAGPQFSKPFKPASLSSDREQNTAWGRWFESCGSPVGPVQTPASIDQIGPQKELPWEFHNTTLYFSASTFTARRNCEVTHADFHSAISPSTSNLLRVQFCG